MFLFLLLLVRLLGLEVEAKEFQAKVIYGDDNRFDLFETLDAPSISASNSSVALVPWQKIQLAGKNFELQAELFGVEKKLCQEERFFEQRTPAFCSGVLIGEDLVLTAGHCVDDIQHCKETAFLFQFQKAEADANPYLVPQNEVYSCKEVVLKEPDELDFALVRLDRKVIGHRPVEVREFSQAAKPANLMAVGYPSGLPLKISKAGRIRHESKKSYNTDLDVSGGSSGSSVFDASGEQLLGIIIEGEEDFEEHKGRACFVSKRCSKKKCSGEEVLKAEVIAPYL